MELHRLTTLGGEAVDFVDVILNGALGHNRHACFFPSDDTAFEVDDLVAFLGKPTCGKGRAFTAAAIHCYRFVDRQHRFRFLDKTVLRDINVDGLLEMAFVEFLGGSHIEQYDIGVGNLLCETVDIGVFITLLATGGQS